MDWFYIIIGAAALQGLLLAAALQRVKNNKPSLSWLSALLIAISVCLVGRIFYDQTLFPEFPKIAIASDLMLFTYGPLMYWYLQSIFYKTPDRRILISRHFIIAIVHLLWICQYLIVPDSEIFRMLSLKSHQTIGQLTEILSWIHVSIYIVAGFREFTQYPKKAKSLISSLPTINFLRYFFILNTTALLMWAAGFISIKLNGNPLSVVLTYNSIWILLTGSVYLIGYYAIVFPQVFRIQSDRAQMQEKESLHAHQPLFVHSKESTSEKNIATVITETATEISKSVTIEIKESKKEITVFAKEKPAFSEIQISEFRKKLGHFMETENPYLNPNLTLPMLAGQLSCSVHLLSKVINESFEKNFFDYINGYRVNYFMQLARQPSNKQFTILSLAFESGYNSKSTFNSSFKKVAGKTPSEFLKSISPQKDADDAISTS